MIIGSGSWVLFVCECDLFPPEIEGSGLQTKMGQRDALVASHLRSHTFTPLGTLIRSTLAVWLSLFMRATYTR